MGKASRARREKIRPILEARETEGLVKRARYYDKVVRYLFVSPQHDELRHSIQSAVIIDGNNVREHLRRDAERDFKQGKDIERIDYTSLNIFPPFDKLWIEYVDTPDWRCAGLLETYQREDQDGYIGHLTFFLDEDGVSRDLPNDDEIYWDENFQCEGIAHGRIVIRDGTDYKNKISAEVTRRVFLFALQLLNCQNVELIDLAPSPDDSVAHERKFGAPMTKYKVLRVNSMGKQYAREEKPQQQFDIMPLHIRRGNFAHYTDDAPLFGKFTGTFWRPATTVGNAKNGMVVKDYKVTP